MSLCFSSICEHEVQGGYEWMVNEWMAILFAESSVAFPSGEPTNSYQ